MLKNTISRFTKNPSPSSVLLMFAGLLLALPATSLIASAIREMLATAIPGVISAEELQRMAAGSWAALQTYTGAALLWTAKNYLWWMSGLSIVSLVHSYHSQTRTPGYPRRTGGWFLVLAFSFTVFATYGYPAVAVPVDSSLAFRVSVFSALAAICFGLWECGGRVMARGGGATLATLAIILWLAVASVIAQLEHGPAGDDWASIAFRLSNMLMHISAYLGSFFAWEYFIRSVRRDLRAKEATARSGGLNLAPLT